MPRNKPFTAASLSFHFQPKMAVAYPIEEGIPAAMQALLEQLAGPSRLTITERLVGLKRLFDEEALAAA